MFHDPLTDQLAGFIRSIGIDVQAATLHDPTLLPGLDIRNGAVLVDATRLAYPGDLLHEAGHVAVADPVQRKQPTLSPTGGDEMATLAWSFAAARHLGVALEILFHPDGYKGGSASLIENFSAGHYVGVPLLQYYGMTVEPRRAAERGVAPFPHMLRWLR
jgi:hypothetical protein